MTGETMESLRREMPLLGVVLIWTVVWVLMPFVILIALCINLIAWAIGLIKNKEDK